MIMKVLRLKFSHLNKKGFGRPLAHVGLAVVVINCLFASPYSVMIQQDVRSIHRYQYFPEEDRIKLREQARRMFYFGYNNYMKYAFPKDELNPIYCTGRGPDYENP